MIACFCYACAENGSVVADQVVQRLQQVPALKRELEEKEDLIAALAEQLAAARESATGSSRQHQEELARLKSEYFFSVFCTNLVLLFALRLYNLAL